MNYELKIQTIKITERRMDVVFSGIADVNSEVAKPKIILHFFNGEDDRRLPLVVREYKTTNGRCFFAGSCHYLLDFIFYDDLSKNNNLKVYANVMFEDYYEEKIPVSLKPQILKYERNGYDVKAEENYLILKRNDKKMFSVRNKSPWYLTVYNFIWKLACICLIPLIFINGLLAESKQVPYETKRSANMKSGFKRVIAHTSDMFKRISGLNFSKVNTKLTLLKFMMLFGKIGPMKSNSIGFLSMRAEEMTGNMKMVYDALESEDRKYYIFCSSKEFRDMHIRDLMKLSKLCSRSKVILLDEHTPFIGNLNLRRETRTIQLWHACGAFKTFGFSRIGKDGGPNQVRSTHRTYSYATVSSTSICKWYAEGFGLPTKRIKPTGVPRTDKLFDIEYRKKTVCKILGDYPELKDKRIVLFAPTFRGSGKTTAYYPMNRLDVEGFMSKIPDDYILIIKHHPFVTEEHPIPEKYSDRVIDMTGGIDINDLLFLVDVVITDYSSLIYEAAMLNLPMLFYAYDLREYIADRDFYFNYETYVPGPICRTQEEMSQIIYEGSFDYEAVETFARDNFDCRDGKATERVCNLIDEALAE